jgi:hypothetical protein
MHNVCLSPAINDPPIGFTLSTLTQVPVLESTAHDIWKYLFWISCAIVMVAALVSRLNE